MQKVNATTTVVPAPVIAEPVVPHPRPPKTLAKRAESPSPMVVRGISHEMLQDTKDFATRLQSCKVSELKNLCRANYLMAKGVKSEIIDRLALAHFHGCPGRCPSCLHAKLEYVYDSHDVIPKEVECKVRAMSHFCISLLLYDPLLITKLAP